MVPVDIYTEPEFDPDTLANLGPLATMAGVFAAEPGYDVHPAAEGDQSDDYRETISLEAIDPQTNGPQLLYGLRYHTRITRLGEVETFHDQVGYWLYEPATSAVSLSLAIPRSQVALAIGTYEPGSDRFTVTAERGSTTNGIASGPFLDEHFTTRRFTMTVTLIDENTWRYEEETLMAVTGRDEVVRHLDSATLVRISPPRPNPLVVSG